MEQTLATALILGLVKLQLDVFHGGSEGNETLRTHGCNSIEIKLSTTSHPPRRISENSFSRDIARSPLPLAASGGEEHSPPITREVPRCDCGGSSTGLRGVTSYHNSWLREVKGRDSSLSNNKKKKPHFIPKILVGIFSEISGIFSVSLYCIYDMCLKNNRIGIKLTLPDCRT